MKYKLLTIALVGGVGLCGAQNSAGDSSCRIVELPDVFNGGFLGNLAESELKNQAARYHRLRQLPFTREEWKPDELREKIWQALGVRVDHAVPLDVEYTGEIQMDGYKILKLSFQSRPGVRVTGNIYAPDGEGPFPAVLNMHGHWEQGRLAERIQQCGHLLAKSGYVCLAVDSFGSGERCPEHGKFVCHGGLLGGGPLQFGESLMGLQLADNIRAVDLLCSLPYVRADKIGACGASGGGNQTMWLAAMDTRIKAAIPVVSVGTFESYIICPNCICEVLPGGLSFTEESGVLALVAPRALMPVNGSYDVNPAFNPAQARRSVDEARRIFAAYGVPQNIRLTITEEPHAFSFNAQRAMLGWFNLHLKGEGNGEPVGTLPQYDVLPEKALMVYPVGKRPKDVVSLPEYIGNLEAQWKKQACFSREKLREILRLEPVAIKHCEILSPRLGWQRIAIEATDQRLMPILYKPPANGGKKVVIFGLPYKKLHFTGNRIIREVLAVGDGLAIVDCWGTGENDLRLDPEYRDRFYNRALMWLGKNLQGKWVEDFMLTEQWLEKALPGVEIAAAGYEESSIAAAMFGALREEKTDLWLERAPETLSYRPSTSKLFGQGFIVPGILTCADMPDLQKASGGKIRIIEQLK